MRYISINFMEHLYNYGSNEVQSLAHNMNRQFGPNEFEEICQIIAGNWKMLYYRPDRFGKKVSYLELRDHVFQEANNNNPQAIKDAVEILKFVLDVLNGEGINRDIDNPFKNISW